MFKERKINKKKPNYLLSFLLVGVALHYIYCGFEALSSGINTKESYIYRFADVVLINLLFTF